MSKGGIRDVLNLRLVCSTTKLWVDRLPKKQADFVFSRVKMVVDLRPHSLRQFLASQLPFKVTTLSLTGLAVKEDPSEWENQDDTCARFCAYWIPKLETLELRSIGFRSPACRLVLELMESPNLMEIFISQMLNLPEDMKLPSCFEKVTKFRTGGILPGDPRRANFYSQIQRNRNLRELKVPLLTAHDLVAVTNLIDTRKEDTELQLKFNVHLPFLCILFLRPRMPGYHFQRRVLQNFANSVANSNSKIALVEVPCLGDFEKLMSELLPRSVCLEFFKSIESLRSWKPTQSSLSLPGLCPHLKGLFFVDTSDSSVDYNRLYFPPSLEEFGCVDGFIPFKCLPSTLTGLHLNNCKFVVGRLQSSLNLIRSSCPSLVSLHIKNWNPTATEEGGTAARFERYPPFYKLKKLIYTDVIWSEKHVEETRSVLANEFDWQNLQLNCLVLDFKLTNERNVPLVGEEIINGLLSGPSGKSLRMLKVPSGCLTAEALPFLKILESFPSVNSELL